MDRELEQFFDSIPAGKPRSRPMPRPAPPRVQRPPQNPQPTYHAPPPPPYAGQSYYGELREKPSIAKGAAIGAGIGALLTFLFFLWEVARVQAFNEAHPYSQWELGIGLPIIEALFASVPLVAISAGIGAFVQAIRR